MMPGNGEPIALRTVPQGVVLILGAAQAILMVVAIVVACAVLLRRQRPGDRPDTPDEP